MLPWEARTAHAALASPDTPSAPQTGSHLLLICQNLQLCFTFPAVLTKCLGTMYFSRTSKRRAFLRVQQLDSLPWLLRVTALTCGEALAILLYLFQKKSSFGEDSKSTVRTSANAFLPFLYNSRSFDTSRTPLDTFYCLSRQHNIRNIYIYFFAPALPPVKLSLLTVQVKCSRGSWQKHSQIVARPLVHLGSSLFALLQRNLHISRCSL